VYGKHDIASDQLPMTFWQLTTDTLGRSHKLAISQKWQTFVLFGNFSDNSLSKTKLLLKVLSYDWRDIKICYTRLLASSAQTLVIDLSLGGPPQHVMCIPILYDQRMKRVFSWQKQRLLERTQIDTMDWLWDNVQCDFDIRKKNMTDLTYRLIIFQTMQMVTGT